MCQLEYLTAIRHGIRLRIKADYQFIFEQRDPVELFAEVCFLGLNPNGANKNGKAA